MQSGLVPVLTGRFAVLDLREVSTSYQGKAEMGWLLLFLMALAIGFWLGRYGVSVSPYRPLGPGRRR